MKFKNNNKGIINKLTKRSLKVNKIRNIFAIFAIAITTILFTSLFTIGMGLVNSMEQQTMRQTGGYAHGTFKYLTKEKFDKIKDHPSIQELGYSIMVNMAENKELLKHHTEIRYATDTQAKMFFSKPTTGNMPEKENEIATDTAVLDLLGVPHKLGSKVKVEYYIGEKKLSKEFVLCGLWKSDEIMPASMMFVSLKFIDKNVEVASDKSLKRGGHTGLIFADVMFKNSRNIKEKMETVVKDKGFSIDEKSPNSIGFGVNWAYTSTNFDKDPSIIMAVSGGILLIIFTGYLIIYNIFQISVIKDIRFYGLLKTIGTTPKQIKKLVKNQALLLSIIGIPIGLVIGYVIGNILLPIIISTSNIKTSYISFSPIIFIGAAIFSIITVFISCRKPGKIAAKVSPVEAVRYIDVTNKGKKEKKSLNGGKIHNMAKYNILRNKKKTILVIVSMSLSLVLLNSVVTFTNGFSMDKYLNKFVITDFTAGNANYFNVTKSFHTEDDVISEQMINSMSKLPGLKESGRIYYNLNHSSTIIDRKETTVQLYGLEDFPLSKLNVVEGKIDLEKLKTGKYIIEGLSSDDNGNIRFKESKFKTGDKVNITFENNITKEYEVMAKAELKHNMGVRYSIVGASSMYLPASEFKKDIKSPLTMSYVFNVESKYIDKTEKFLNSYTKTIEPQMNYESKQKYVDDFKSFQNMFLIVGGVLSFIIGAVGILNFINAMLTSIISRLREFAMLQSIGMTNKQLNKMLRLEGVFYAFATIVTSILFGSLTSLMVVNPIGSSLWFFNYKFTISPILIAAPILVVVSIIVPFIIYINVGKQTIVERLRQVE